VKKTKLKFPKHQPTYSKGLGTNTIALFKGFFGINRHVAAKKFLKIKKTGTLFKKFAHSTFLDKPNRAHLPFYSYNQRSYDQLTFLKTIQNYRALRHLAKLPVRGQRSKTNAKTRSKRAITRRKKKAVK